jgi:transposase
MFFRLFTLCRARVSVVVTVLSDNPCVRILVQFWKGADRWWALVGEPVTNIATSLVVSRVTVSKVISAYTNHGKTTSAKSNSGRKSTLTERDRAYIWGFFSRKITALLQHRWTAAEPKIHLEDPVSTKTAQRELHKSNFHGRAATAEPLITESNAQMRNGGVTTVKPGHQTTGNARVAWPDESSFTLLPTSGRVYVWGTAKEVYNPECPVPAVKHWEVLWWFGQQYHGTVFCWSHYYPSWPNYCKEERGQVG